MEIKSISRNLFTRKQNVTENSNKATNPFGVSFKGSIINADVFEKNNANNTKNENRMLKSAVVGSINSISSAISSRFNSLISFKGNLQEKTSNWAQSISARMTNLAETFPAFSGAYNVNRLRQHPIAKLEGMLKAALSDNQ